MKQWYIAKKRTSTRWVAYELDKQPEIKCEHEMRGPYKNLVECLVAINPPKKSR